MRRLVQKEIDGYIELELVQHALNEVVIGQRHFRIEANREQAANFIAIDFAKDFVDVDSGFRNFFFGYASDFGGAARRPLFHVIGDRLKARCVIFDESVIEPIVFDHQMQDSIEKRYVAPWLDWQEEIAGARDRSDARIDDDY